MKRTTRRPVERYRIGLDLLGEPEGTILDIGCSMGILEDFIPSIGVDVHRHAIREAKKKSPGTQFMLADAERLPFRADSVDAVIMLDTLEHINNESRALAEISRILKRDGTIVLSVPHDRIIYNLIDLEFWLFPFVTSRPRHRHYSRGGVRKLLSLHNLDVMTFLEKGLVFSAIIQWVLLPFDVVDYSLFGRIRGPLGGYLRDLIVDRFVDSEFDIDTTCGRTLFVRARKRSGSNPQPRPRDRA